ncbi:hypothetical protein JB92DRAFT_2905587, partial [Gautieria morchelliformis]
MYHAIISTYQVITIALFLGISGRLVGDFLTRCDSWNVASTLLGIAFGVVMADIVSYLYEDTEWTTIEVIGDIWETCSVDERPRRKAPRLGRRLSEPRRIEELPTVYEELSSIESRSRIEDAEPQSDVEREVARLRAKALSAAGQRRRFREERKWAWSQGNFARAFQLRWQVKKYQALADSFTREADQKLLEADRAKRKPSSPPPQEERYYRSDREPAPFVQVVVERGVHEHDSDDECRVNGISSDQAHKVTTKTTTRMAKDITKRKSGVHIDSRGYLTRSGYTRDAAVSVGSNVQSPATSDTWSRLL